MPSPTEVAGGPLKPSSSPVTPSQTMHVHLNKVAWWLDLQASQSLGQLPSGASCDPLGSVASTAVVEHDSAAIQYSGSPDAAVHAKLHVEEKVSTSSLSWDRLSGITRAEGSRQSAEGTMQPPKGSSQGLTGSSQPVDGSGSLQQGAMGMLAPPISTSRDGFTSAAVTGNPGSLTVLPRAASPAQTSCGPELQNSSEHEAPADSKAACAVTANTTADESRQHARGVGWLQIGDLIGHHRYVKNTVNSAYTVMYQKSDHVRRLEFRSCKLLGSSQSYSSYIVFVCFKKFTMWVVLSCAVCCTALYKHLAVHL